MQEQFEGNLDFSGASGSPETQETCSDQGTGSRIFRKIEELSNKVQIVKEDNALLCNEVMGLTADSLLGSEYLAALQTLSTEHELLKKKHSEEIELLKNKYLEECSKRKILYNEVIELKGNIRVFCRCRPLTRDTNDISTSVVDVVSESELQILCTDSSRKQFKFDHVFRSEDSQEVVFAQTLPIVTSILDGYNGCIFAYGQTGTGKTYTMEGTPDNRGVNYRTLEELFRLSNGRSGLRYELFVSMLEVYNEKIRDLLVEDSHQPAKKLEIKQSMEGTQEVPGLVEAQVFGTDEVWELLTSGSRIRSIGSTNANEMSSRSHCLVRVTVVGENLINGQRTKSHLWLVDLAGSERIGKIEVEGDRLKESQFINKSLSALGDVISALASKTSHIPYRNSKLTHILQTSLGGDCKTLMFVQVSPDAADLGETLCSLNFASRVRGVEHGPARKQQDHLEFFKYKQIAEKAKQDEKETKRLQDNLQSMQLRLAAREHICRNLQEKVRDLENQLAEERKTRLKHENRALASISTHSQSTSTSNLGLRATERKPPLAPTKLRLPLRRITNFTTTSPAAAPLNKNRMSVLPILEEHKENMLRPVASENRTKTIMKARRGSIAVQPSQSSNKLFQPRRRASIATIRPESNSSSMTTPLHNPSIRPRGADHTTGRKSFVWDPQRWKALRLSSPLRRSREMSVAATIEATPIGTNRKFGASPPTQISSLFKTKHQTIVALQKKHLVWSPLKLRGMRNNRNSLLSS